MLNVRHMHCFLSILILARYYLKSMLFLYYHNTTRRRGVDDFRWKVNQYQGWIVTTFQSLSMHSRYII